LEEGTVEEAVVSPAGHNTCKEVSASPQLHHYPHYPLLLCGLARSVRVAENLARTETAWRIFELQVQP
jgi:hypothetical protein